MRDIPRPGDARDVEAKLAPRQIRDGLGLSREHLARALDVSTRTIERWEERGEVPGHREHRERLAQLEEIVDLGQVVYGPETFRKFLTLPMPAFEGRTAIQFIERGEAERVLQALAADYEGQGF